MGKKKHGVVCMCCSTCANLSLMSLRVYFSFVCYRHNPKKQYIYFFFKKRKNKNQTIKQHNSFKEIK